MELQRKQVLETLIADSFAIIREWRQIGQTSGRPEERLDAQRHIETQWDNVAGYLTEYRALTGGALPAHIAQIAAHFGPIAETAQDERPPSTVVHIDTGGGMYIGGNVSNTGSIVGRDQITTGASGDELARLFRAVYARIDARPNDPNVDKRELAETAQKIEREAQQGEAANTVKIERWLRFLAGMAGDIFDVVVDCLRSPAAGVARVVKNVAARVKAERPRAGGE